MLPAVSQAHVSVQSAELLAGALHPWITPDSALVLVGLALWLAQNSAATELSPFVALALGLAAGVASGLFLPFVAPAWLVFFLALAAGLCVGTEVRPVAAIMLPTVGGVALMAGHYAGADAAADIKYPLAFLAGALAGGLVFPLTLVVLLPGRRPRVVQIGIRVLGSWLAAIALMLLALRLRGPS